MEVTQEYSSRGRQSKSKSNLIVQTWKRCKSLGRSGANKISSPQLVRSLSAKSKSWPSALVSPSPDRNPAPGTPSPRRRRCAPEGRFFVYVGPQKERFVLRTECINHPLFRMLLEEAESEYGYNPQGPLALPCNVNVFYDVLVAMDDNSDCEVISPRRGCVGFARNGYGFGSYDRLPSPSRMIVVNQV